MVLLSEAKVSERWLGAAGVVFVVLFLASASLGASDLGGPEQVADVVARDFTQNRLGKLRLAAALVGISAIAGYGFVGGLGRKLASSSPSATPWVVFGAGLGMITMTLATSLFAQAAVMVESLNADPQVAKTLWLIEHGSWALIAPPQIAFILAVSSLALREGLFPRWFGLSGPPVAAGLLANMAWGTGSLAGAGLLWVLGLGVIVLVRPLR